MTVHWTYLCTPGFQFPSYPTATPILAFDIQHACLLSHKPLILVSVAKVAFVNVGGNALALGGAFQG